MTINKETHYFEDLNDQEASILLVLAEKLHMRATCPVDHPILREWLTLINPSDSLFVTQAVMREYLPVRLAISVARYFKNKDKQYACQETRSMGTAS